MRLATFLQLNEHFFWLHPQHVQSPRPGIEPVLWQQSMLLHWQCQILNLLHYKGTPKSVFLKTPKKEKKVVINFCIGFIQKNSYNKNYLKKLGFSRGLVWIWSYKDIQSWSIWTHLAVCSLRKDHKVLKNSFTWGEEKKC